jgi:AcrR family transcriptional regulator
VDAALAAFDIFGVDTNIRARTFLESTPTFWCAVSDLASLPLRQRKLAQTKHALLEAAVARLDTTTLEELEVRALCADVGISQASFFNYFPKKSDLLVFFVQVWSLDMAWHTLARPAARTARANITRLFDLTAEAAAAHPGVMAEVLAGQARMRAKPTLTELTLAERVVAFPGREAIADLPARGLDSLLPELLTRAVAGGELPPRTDVMRATLGLSAIFLGVPIAILRVDPHALRAAYRAQLAVYWRGLSARPRRPPSR